MGFLSSLVQEIRVIASGFFYPVLGAATLATGGLLTFEGSVLRCLSSYRHQILPLHSEGRTLNYCWHIKKVTVWNKNVNDVIVTTGGLRVRLKEKGLKRIAPLLKDGIAFRIVFEDPCVCCEVAMKVQCCLCCRCPEMTEYTYIRPDEAYIAGKDATPMLNSCCTSFLLTRYPCFFCCVKCCEFKVNIHSNEYELVDFNGDFVDEATESSDAPPIVRCPASPRGGVAPTGFQSPYATASNMEAGIQMQPVPTSVYQQRPVSNTVNPMMMAPPPAMNPVMMAQPVSVAPMMMVSPTNKFGSLQEFLARNDLAAAYDPLVQRNIDLPTLRAMNETDLGGLGFNLGTRKKIVKALAVDI